MAMVDPGIKRFLAIVDHFPGLEKLPVSLARVLYECFSYVSCPSIKNLPGDQLKIFDQKIVPHEKWPKVRGCLNAEIGEFRQPLRVWESVNLSPNAPALLFFHGGGWCLGSRQTHGAFCAMIAKRGFCKVISVEYRLAPQHPFPAAIQDAMIAWQWLSQENRSQAQQEPCRPLYVGGDSAGGNLAAVLCHLLKAEGKEMPKGQFLLYPAVDCRENWDSFAQFGQGHMFTLPMWRTFLHHYAGNLDQWPLEQIAPLHNKNFSGQPKTYIALAGCDLFRDQGIAYAKALKEAGVDITLEIFPDLIHGFVNMLSFEAPWKGSNKIIDSLQNLMIETVATQKEVTYG